MRRWLHHGANELRLRWVRARRYAFETLLGLGLLFALLAGLVAAVLQVTGKSLSSGAADGLLLGFVIWYFATGAYASACEDIAEETRQRTLEPLCVAPLSLPGLLGLRALLGLLLSLAGLLVGLWAVGQLTQGRLRLQSLQAMVPVLLAAPSLIGVGLASAGVLLLAKRAEAMPAVFSLALMGLVALPAYPLNAWGLLPYALGAAAAKAAAAGSEVPVTALGWIGLNAVVYLALGLAVLAWAHRRARHLGILGHG